MLHMIVLFKWLQIRKFVNSYTVHIPPRCPPRLWPTHRRWSHAASLTRVCGSTRVPTMLWTASLGAPVPLLYVLCVSRDARRAMRGQAFGASEPSHWAGLRCLRTDREHDDQARSAAQGRRPDTFTPCRSPQPARAARLSPAAWPRLAVCLPPSACPVCAYLHMPSREFEQFLWIEF